MEILPGVFKFSIGDIMGKPRMTRRDKWKKRAVVERYNAFKDELRLRGVTIPECGYHLIVVIPMPPSWTQIKKNMMDGTPHLQKPDKDNIEKGILDTLYKDDSRVWDGRVSKYWGREACIYIKLIGFHASLEEAINARP